MIHPKVTTQGNKMKGIAKESNKGTEVIRTKHLLQQENCHRSLQIQAPNQKKNSKINLMQLLTHHKSSKGTNFIFCPRNGMRHYHTVQVF